MNDLIEFLTSQEIIVVYILIGVACFLYFVIYLFDKTYYKRKRKQNTKELNKIIEDIKELEPEETLVTTESLESYQKPVMEPILPIEQVQPEIVPVVAPQPIAPVAMKEVENVEIIAPPKIEMQKENLVEEPIIQPVVDSTEKVENLVLDSMLGVKEEIQIVDENKESHSELQYTDIEPKQWEAQAELQKLTEALEQAAEETKNIELTVFEEEQEQNAIISLDELLTKGKAMYENHEFDSLEDEGNEPISLQDLELHMNKRKEATLEIEKEVVEEPVIIEPVQEKMVLDEFNNIKIEEPKPTYQEHKKFQSSPVISPVYGIEKKPVTEATEIALENTANYDKLDEEIKKTNEFLMTLKELQKNLD